MLTQFTFKHNAMQGGTRGLAGSRILQNSSAGPSSGSAYRAWAKDRSASSASLSGVPSSGRDSSADGSGGSAGSADNDDALGAAAKQYIEQLYEKPSSGGDGELGVVKKGGYRAWAAQKKRLSIKGSPLADDGGASEGGAGGSGAGGDSGDSANTAAERLKRLESRKVRRLSRSLLDVTASSSAVSRKKTKASKLDEVAAKARALEEAAASEAQLAALHDVGLVALDTLALFVRDFQDELRADESVFLSPCVAVLCQLAKQRQSVTLLAALLDTMRAFVIDLGDVFFGGRSSEGAALLSKLVFHTLRFCGSAHGATRGRATALLCVLARENVRHAGHIARLKLQATVGVSKLVRRGDGDGAVSFAMLRAALRAAARSCAAESATLGAELTALAERAEKVLRDSQRIAEYRWDPETTADLYYEIARGYADAPDLRVVWLANLAKFHADRGARVEAANVQLVAAALVARCLRALGRDEAGCVPQRFGRVYAGATRERLAPRRRALVALGNDVCRSGAFSESGVVNLLRDAIAHFEAEQLHEARMVPFILL